MEARPRGTRSRRGRPREGLAALIVRPTIKLVSSLQEKVHTHTHTYIYTRIFSLSLSLSSSLFLISSDGAMSDAIKSASSPRNFYGVALVVVFGYQRLLQVGRCFHLWTRAILVISGEMQLRYFTPDGRLPSRGRRSRGRVCDAFLSQALAKVKIYRRS